MTPKHARLPDRVVAYHEAGHGRPLLLLHAFPFSADQWLPQLAAVPAGWRFIAPDLRGFRGAGRDHHDGGLESATMATHAGDMLGLMDHLDIERAVLGGLSMGGYVALALQGQAPGRIEGLVLADTKATADDAAGREARDKTIALVAEKGPAALADAMLPKLLGESSVKAQPGLQHAVRAAIAVNGADAIISALRAMREREDHSSRLPHIACPTLVMCGAEDVLTPPKDSEAMAKAIPRARLVILPDTGHLANLEAPEAFNKELRRFLEEVN